MADLAAKACANYGRRSGVVRMAGSHAPQPYSSETEDEELENSYVPSEFSAKVPASCGSLSTRLPSHTVKAELDAKLEEWMQRIDGKVDTIMLQLAQQALAHRPGKRSVRASRRFSTTPSCPTSPRLSESEGPAEGARSLLSLPSLASKMESRTSSTLQNIHMMDQLPVEAIGSMQNNRHSEMQAADNSDNIAQKVSDFCVNVYHTASKLADKPRREPPPTFWQRAVRGRVFACMVVMVVTLNTILIGIQAQMEAHGQYVGETRRWMDAAGHLCSAFYAAELGLRMLVEPLHKHLQPEDRGWFVLDCSLVFLCGLELALQVASTNVDLRQAINAGRMIRALRLVRITRVVKMFRFLTQLRVMVTMILTSLSSLFWLFILLFLMVYVCAVVLTQGMADYAHQNEAYSQNFKELQSRFRDLPSTIEALFALTTGADWSDDGHNLRSVNWTLYAVLLLYVFFSFFSVLNIVNGVFVDNAIRYSRQDRDLVAEQKAQEKLAAKKLCAAEFRRILAAMDKDDDHIISAQEFRDGIKGASDLLDSLEVAPKDAEELFKLLDVDGNGEVTVDEFVDGILKLQADTSPFDMHLLMYQNRKLLSALTEMRKY
mmetsp:Transcript_38734/g.91048  ORF Transcript_38734/g.91048 Transcript_38734/m.91048 type:complete len:603 (+) Transcript_38734:128-1936(+)